VSKPPDPAVARLGLGQRAGTPAVAVFLCVTDLDRPAGTGLARYLGAGAIAAAQLAGGTPPDPARGLADRAARAAARLPEQRRVIRGLYSGRPPCDQGPPIIS